MLPLVVFVALLSAVSTVPRSVSAALDAMCEGVLFGTFPHPDDCRQYVVCLGGQPRVLLCPTGYVFHPSVLFCVQQSSPFPCSEASTSGPPPESPEPGEPPTSARPEPSTTAEPGCVGERPTWESFFCQDVRRPLVANPMNCTQYISCRAVPPRNQHCPPGTVYSDPYQDCLPGDGRACSMRPVDAEFCADRPDGSYAHPFQCNRFISCVQQQLRLEACPPFFVFDPSVAHCVKGNAIACSTLSALS